MSLRNIPAHTIHNSNGKVIVLLYPPEFLMAVSREWSRLPYSLSFACIFSRQISAVTFGWQSQEMICNHGRCPMLSLRSLSEGRFMV